MYQLYYTASGKPWSTRELIWKSDMAIDPVKYGIYNMRCGVEINKAGELQFTMTQSCSSYNKFRKERSVLTLLMDDSTPIFRGVVKLIETDLFFQRTITANSDLIYLSDSVFEPHGDDIEQTPTARFKQIIDRHNAEMQGDPEKQFEIGNFTFASGADKVEKYTKNGGYKDTMSQLKDDFKDFYGFYNVRYNADFSKKWLDYTETTGKSTSQDIKFAVNIEDYQYKDTVDDLFTVLIPIGSDNLVLSNQNSHKTVAIRLPDQSTKNIEVYVVDKYIKIVEGIENYGYIYQAESFTVDSNNVGSSGINGSIATSWSGKRSSGGGGGGDEYVYSRIVLMNQPGHQSNPAALGCYYISNGEYVQATETTPVAGRAYYLGNKVTKTANSTSGGGGSSGTYTAVQNIPVDANPKALGYYEKRAFSFDKYIATNDTEVRYGKTYYTRSP